MRKTKLATRFSTTIVLFLATSLVFFIPSIQSTLSHTSLLEQICRQSPEYHFCIMILRSSVHHRSKEDIAGFARLTLEIVNANASITLEHIHKAYVQTWDRELKVDLEYCVSSYKTIVKVHLREAINAMDNGDYKVVEQMAYAAGIQAESCDNKLRNPATLHLRNTNRYVQNLCAITVSIVNKLFQPYQPT